MSFALITQYLLRDLERWFDSRSNFANKGKKIAHTVCPIIIATHQYI